MPAPTDSVGRKIVGTWTYSGNPAIDNKDRVRWYLGDTEDTDPLVSDEEIAAAIADEGSNRAAAAACADHLAAYFARECDKNVNDNVSHMLSQRHKHFAALGLKLKARGAIIATPFAGGTSISDKESRADDTDRPTPAFQIGQFDHEGTDTDDTSTSVT